MKRILISVVCVALWCVPVAALAHTDTELEEWLMAWERGDSVALSVDLPEGRMMRAIRADLWAEVLAEMQQRHPCREVIGTWVEECDRPTISTGANPEVPSPGAGAATADRGMGSNVEQWRGLVASYSWNADIALCLMAKESGGNPNAQNRSSGASGLMQVLPSWADNFGYTPADLFIPEVNIAISYALYVDGGWGHWSPWNRGACH